MYACMYAWIHPLLRSRISSKRCCTFTNKHAYQSHVRNHKITKGTVAYDFIRTIAYMYSGVLTLHNNTPTRMKYLDFYSVTTLVGPLFPQSTLPKSLSVSEVTCVNARILCMRSCGSWSYIDRVRMLGLFWYYACTYADASGFSSSRKCIWNRGQFCLLIVAEVRFPGHFHAHRCLCLWLGCLRMCARKFGTRWNVFDPRG